MDFQEISKPIPQNAAFVKRNLKYFKLMRNHIKIFYFHSISDKLSASYPSMPVKVFDMVCALLKRNFNIIPLDEIGNNFMSKKPTGIITFDDGFYDFYENALPVLCKHRLPVTQHLVIDSVNTGHTHWSQKLNDILDAYFFNALEVIIPELNIRGKLRSRHETEKLSLNVFLSVLLNDSIREEIIKKLEAPVESLMGKTRMMSWDEVRECMKYNVVFGSHTCTHRNLTQLSEEDLKAELARSKSEIEQKLNYDTCLSLAYPHGQFNNKVRELSIDAGYRYLLTTLHRSVDLPVNRFDLPRFSLYNNEYWKNFLKLTYFKYCK